MKKATFITAILIIITSTSVYGQVERHSKQGYQGMLNIKYAIGAEHEGTNIVELHLVNGYRFSEYLFVGGGIGVNYYYQGTEDTFIPVYVDFRAYFANNEVTPYINVNIGYSFHSSKKEVRSCFVGMNCEYKGNVSSSGGLFFNPSVGVTINLPDTKSALNIGIGYQLQKLSSSTHIVTYTESGASGIHNSSSTSSLNAIDISVGISF